MPVRFLVCLILLLSSPAMAEKLIGFGYVNSLVGVNLEWAFERNTVYALPGFNIDYGGSESSNDDIVTEDEGGLQTDDFRWILGMRHRIEGGSTASDGFFTGVMVGDLGGRQQYERLGVGGELGYQWVKDYTRWTLSAGLAGLEEQEERNLDAEPEAFLSLTISLRR
jgi:hypothetical protein